MCPPDVNPESSTVLLVPADPSSANSQVPDVAQAAGSSASSVASPPHHDDDVFDHDSLAGDDASTTASLSSSSYLFEKRNGRTYHKFRADQQYLLPNDEPEKDRMDMQFWAIHEVFEARYFFAPIVENPQAILDVGTGTGMWAMDVGDKFPSAIVLGTDLSPIQPTWVPPNVQFELHDCTQYPWDFDQKYDLIHTQLINGFAIRDWDAFYEEAYKNLRPGGWVESQEFDLMVYTDDNSLPNPSAILNWLKQWNDGAGGFFRIQGQQLADAMTRVGLVNVVVEEFKMPIGRWMKGQENSGMLSLSAMTEHIEGLSNRLFMEQLGMTEEQMREYTVPVVEEWRNRKIHTYWPMYVVYGMRPVEDRTES